MAEGKNAILIGMSQWNSNDLVEQIETMGKLDEPPGESPSLPDQVCTAMFYGGVGLPVGAWT